MTEERIIRGIQSGKSSALEALMDCYLPYVSAVVWGVGGGQLSKEDAEEVAADVFVTAWQRPEDLRPGHLKGWLGTVARNKARNRLRSVGGTFPLEEVVQDTLCVASPEEAAQQDAIKTFLLHAVEALGIPDSEIFIRYYYYGQPLSAVSQALALPVGTVKSRLYRGRQKLRQVLEEGGYCCETALE